MQNYRIGSGLSNLGNTCFFNAVIQAILHTQSLAQYFSNNEHSNSCQSNKWCIQCALENLWHQTKKNRVSSPLGIVHNLKTVFKKFRLGRQEDSHQFLRYLVQGMQEVETGKLGKDRLANEQKIVKTKTFKVFGGRMRNCVRCHNCGYKSLTSQRYYDLNIECQKSSNLIQGISNFFRSDQLKGINKYYCQKCQTHSNANKSSQIITVPDVITFQLKRFTNSLRKIGKMIQYPKYLNIGKYFQDPVELFKLQLYAVIVHSGYSSGSGHYYSFVKWNGQWYEMNDSHVSPCTQERALNQQAYIIFYKRITPKNVLRKDSIFNIEEEGKQKEDAQQEDEELKMKQVYEKQKQTEKQKEKEERTKDFHMNGIQKMPQSAKKQDFNHDIPENNLGLKRRKSKEEVLAETPLQQLLLKYSHHLFELATKMPSYGKRHRGFQPVYNLRKFEMAMKRKKFG